jgi:SAM-dependent methyltransferase
LRAKYAKPVATVFLLRGLADDGAELRLRNQELCRFATSFDPLPVSVEHHSSNGTQQGARMKSTKIRQYLTYHQAPGNAANDAPYAEETVEQLYDRATLAAVANPKLTRYMNIGHWTPQTTTPEQAGDNLMDLLVSGIAARSTSASPDQERVLDVACGLGATTRYLCRRWRPANIHAINITESQLAVARRTAPGCHFEIMPATDLRFPAGYFDHIVCVEAAFQFETRQRFLEEAHRVLKPGGTIALTDVLLVPEGHDFQHRYTAHHPKENFCASPDEYRARVEAAGFGDCQVTDITEPSVQRYQVHSLVSLFEQWRTGRLTYPGLRRHLDALCLLECLMSSVVMCIATRQ